MLRKAFYVIAALIAVLLIAAAFQPATFHIERTAVIQTPPSQVYALVNEFRTWPSWSPFHQTDPNMMVTYATQSAGQGASMHWSGNDEAGEGKMTMLQNDPYELIRIRLEFIRPFAAVNTADFTFVETAENQTRVTWAMYGENSFLGRIMGIFMNMDDMIGPEFEKGLTNLKVRAES